MLFGNYFLHIANIHISPNYNLTRAIDLTRQALLAFNFSALMNYGPSYYIRDAVPNLSILPPAVIGLLAVAFLVLIMSFISFEPASGR